MKPEVQPTLGSAAPDFAAQDVNGNSVRLSQYWAASPIVTVFMRHLGCTFCRQHVQELRSRYDEFRGAGADVVCIAMGDAKVGKAFQVLFDLPFPMLMVGDDLTAYKLYGLGKGTLGQLLGLNMWIKGFSAMRSLGAKTHGGLMGDGYQMPGTFIIDSGGIVRYAYRSENAADNPSNRLLLDQLQKSNQSTQGGSTIEESISIGI